MAMKKAFSWGGALIILFLLIGGIIIAQSNQGHRGYKFKTSLIASLSSGNTELNQTVSYVSEHGICKQITGNLSESVFIPTKTTGEWQAFIDNPPSGVSLGECGCTKDNDCGDNGVCVGYVGPGHCGGVNYTIKEWKMDNSFVVDYITNELNQCIGGGGYNGHVLNFHLANVNYGLPPGNASNYTSGYQETLHDVYWSTRCGNKIGGGGKLIGGNRLPVTRTVVAKVYACSSVKTKSDCESTNYCSWDDTTPPSVYGSCVEVKCGTANGKTYSSFSTDLNLCNLGTATNISNDRNNPNIVTWNCGNKNCSLTVECEVDKSCWAHKLGRCEVHGSHAYCPNANTKLICQNGKRSTMGNLPPCLQ